MSAPLGKPPPFFAADSYHAIDLSAARHCATVGARSSLFCSTGSLFSVDESNPVSLRTRVRVCRLQLDGHLDATLTFIPTHIEFILCELLKNSMRYAECWFVFDLIGLACVS